MAIGGTRLDRPSAVGDEGRPRATSVTVAALAVVALAGLTLWAIDELPALTALGLAVMFQVGGLGLLARDRLGELVVGHLLYHTGAFGLLLLLLVVPLLRDSLVLLGLFLGLFGVAATWADVLVTDRLQTASKKAAVSYVALLGWIAVWVAGLGFVASLLGGIWDVLGGTDPFRSLTWFLVAVLAAALLVRLAVRVLPVVELTRVNRREARRRQVGRIRTATSVVGLAAFACLALTGMVGPRGLGALTAANPALESLLGVLSGPFVLGPVLLAAGLAGLAAAAGVIARQLAIQIEAGNHGAVAAVLAGAVLSMIVMSLLYVPLFLVPGLAPLLLALALVASPAAIVLGFLLIAGVQTGLLPTRTAAPALAAAGLVLAAIGAGLGSVPAPLVFALVAAALLVWDLCTFGQGLTVELGHRPETRRLELYHAVLSVGVGAVAVLAATGLEWIRGSLGSAVGAWPAVGLAVAGAILLALASRT